MKIIIQNNAKWLWLKEFDLMNRNNEKIVCLRLCSGFINPLQEVSQTSDVICVALGH